MKEWDRSKREIKHYYVDFGSKWKKEIVNIYRGEKFKW